MPIPSKTLYTAICRNKEIEHELVSDPRKFRILTGDRPTGRLHVGHYFGTLQNRVRLQNLGVETCILIADYQVLTDRDRPGEIKQNVLNLMLDYLSIGMEWPPFPDSRIHVKMIKTNWKANVRTKKKCKSIYSRI